MKRNIRSIVLLLFFGVSLVLLFIVILAIASRQKQTYTSKAQEIPSPSVEQIATESARLIQLRGEIEEKNTSLLDLLDQYKQGDDERKKALTPFLSQRARERVTLLLEILTESPRVVYEKAFTQDILSQFPQETQEILEKRVSTQGSINTYIFDNFENNTSFETATLIDTATNEEMSFYAVQENPTSFLSGTAVKVENAVKLQKSPSQALSSSSSFFPVKSVYAQETNQENQNQKLSNHLIAVEITVIEKPTLNTKDTQSVLFLLIKDSDLPENITLPSPEVVTEEINTYTKDFYERVSYSKLFLKPTVYPEWLSLKIDDDDLKYKEFSNFIKANWNIAEKTISLAEEKNIDIARYDRLFFIASVKQKKKKVSFGGYGSIGRASIKTRKHIFTSSLGVALYNLEDPDSIDLTFREITPHEFGHNLGAYHAMSAESPDYILRTSKLTDYIYPLFEYGNLNDIMGSGRTDAKADLNPYTKYYFGWLDAKQMVKVDIKNPEGTYTIQQYNNYALEKKLPVAIWLPFATDTKNIDDRDYFLSYQEPPYSALTMIFEKSPFFHTASLDKSILFTPVVNLLEDKEGSFIDTVHELVIKLDNIDDSKKTLSFTIQPFEKKEFYVFFTNGGYAPKDTVSRNIFENDLLKKGYMSGFESGLYVENNMIGSHYCFSLSQNQQGQLKLSSYRFLNYQKNCDIKIIDSFLPLQLLADISLYDPHLTLSTELGVNLKSGNVYKHVYFQYRLIPSTEEYKNDLEPGPLFISFEKSKSNEHNIAIQKGEKLFFRTTLRNNSRNPFGNKSRDFQVEWTIIDEKGDNKIQSFFTRVEGIAPQDSTSQEFEWTVPDDFSAGNYRVIFEADPRGRIEEFNEENNQIWRDFQVILSNP